MEGEHLPGPFRSAEVIAHLRRVGAEVGESSLVQLVRAAWQDAEETGGIGSRALKECLLGTAMDRGFDESEARRCIDANMPGPADYAIGQPLAADDLVITGIGVEMGRSGIPVVIATVDEIPGHDIAAVLGLVSGSTVRTKHIGVKFVASIGQVVGGELTAFTDLLNSARTEAIGRMINETVRRGGNGVIGVRLTTADVFDGTAEVCAYGTAVRVVESAAADAL